MRNNATRPGSEPIRDPPVCTSANRSGNMGVYVRSGNVGGNIMLEYLEFLGNNILQNYTELLMQRHRKQNTNNL